MLIEDLMRLGLNSNEAVVYIALQQAGKTKAGQLIKHTGLHRNLVYQALQVLGDKRLIVKTTTGSVALFQVSDPIHFLDGIKEQELTAERVIEALAEQKKLGGQEITVYEGAEGIRAYCLKNAAQLKLGQNIHVIGTGGPRLEKAMGTQAIKKYFSLIEKKGGIRVLAYRAQQYTEQMYALIRNKSMFKFRLLSTDSTPSAGVIFTEEQVGFVIYEGEGAVIEVRNPALVHAYKQYFELLWNETTQTLNGLAGVNELCERVLAEKGDLYLIAATGTILSVYPEPYQQFTQKRVEQGIHLYALANESVRRTPFAKLPNSTIAYLPPEFESPMVVWVFGDYVANVLWEKPEKIFLTHDKRVAESYRQYYSALKKISKP